MSAMVAVRFINSDETCALCKVRDSFVLVRHGSETFAACHECIEAHREEHKAEREAKATA